MRDDIYVYLRNDLPCDIHEMVMPCLNGYTVYINSRLNFEEMGKAYEHALKHIENGDFDCDCSKSVQDIETEAHGVHVQLGAFDPKRHKKRRKSARMNFLERSGYDFFGAAERKWLEPEG